MEHVGILGLSDMCADAPLAGLRTRRNEERRGEGPRRGRFAAVALAIAVHEL